MMRINLLPWRAARRKQKKEEFLAVTLLALFTTAVILAFVHFNIAGMIDHQNQRNQFLQAEVTRLDKSIKEIEELEAKKKRLLARMEIIQRLQSSRPEIVHLFDELARTIPEGVYLIDLAQTEQSITMNGIAQSNARVSAYMRNLESSPWLKEPMLNIIERKQEAKEKKESGSRFALQVKQASSKTEEAAKEVPAKGGKAKPVQGKKTR
jgi:type IV pilus assembly protein PilN